MSTSTNREIAEKWFAAVNDGDTAAIQALVHDDWVDHNTMPGQPTGKAGAAMHVEVLRGIFSELKITVDDIICEGNRVVARYSSTGRNTGSFMGIPPTNKIVTSTGISIWRIRDGLVAEMWAEWDALGTLQQLGGLPS